MTTFYIKNTNKKELDLVTALNLAKPFDTIKLADGDYFSDDEPYYFNLKKSVNIIGDNSNNRAIKLHAYLLIGDDVQIILKNMTISSGQSPMNTVGIYDDAHFYAENVRFLHPLDNNWNTIFCKNASFALYDSVVSTADIETAGLYLENCPNLLVNDTINTLYLKNSNCKQKDCLINHSIGVDFQSSLTFIRMTVNANDKRPDSDFYALNNSIVEGRYLAFTTDSPIVDVFSSSFASRNFYSDVNKIQWNIDDESTVRVDGYPPYNNRSFD
ncbi:hypothetical protein [Companilactobacillus futsaii]|uniref:hypothetical protein n=1 Tax=Companilactobacillus futsaii TaxID=938155 RepID=UPI0018A07957|nr:hypothetical protein [Companilactobacillus futsaii]